MSDRKNRMPEVSEERASQRLSFRERAAFRILWLMLTLVYPMKYKHEADGVYNFILRGGDGEKE